MDPNVADKQVAMRALSAVDLALWDVGGKAMGVPLHRLLGGCKEDLPVIGYCYYDKGESAESIAETMLGQKESGYGGTKLKVGGVAVEEDVRRVAAIRKAVGDAFILACDANMAWTIDEALRFARQAQEYGIAWLEEPVRWHYQVEGMRRVRQETAMRVTAGQSEVSGFGCMDLMKAGAVDFLAVDFLNVDASITGGITEWRRLAGAAHFFDVGMVHHEEPQVALHLLAAVPHSFCAEMFPDPERDPVAPDVSRASCTQGRQDHSASGAGTGHPA